MAVDDRWQFVSVTTSHEIPGMTLIEHQGEVCGITVRARNLFTDFGTGVRNVAGGESRAYSDLLAEARREAVDRMRKQAHELGANVVVAMRMSASPIFDGLIEVAAYGAAVRAEDIAEHWDKYTSDS
jgi:uncharacterized protein YbjQ (UPF0145 family)